jgi:twitching motility protein PilT
LSLRAVVSQYLLPSARAGEKRVLAMEILLNNTAIAGALRAGKIEAVDNIILTGRADGMLTLDESIKQRLREGAISKETAERFVRRS